MSAPALHPSPAVPTSPRAPDSDLRETPVARAALRALAYADVFAFPLELTEVHRYLPGRRATLAEVAGALEELVRAGRLRCEDGRFALAASATRPAARRALAAPCERHWRGARRWGRAIARLPFVRMVAVTGALAADNPDGGDLDYFVVTAGGRLWTARALMIQLVVRPARLAGDVVCPNYLLAEDRLALAERDPFAARELLQMVPLAGLDIYARLRDENRWADALLPNAGDLPGRAAREEPRPSRRTVARSVERALGGATGEALERFERQRKIRELRRRHGTDQPEVELDAGCCKGHYSAHRRRILEAWHTRLAQLGLAADDVEGSGER